MRLVGLGAAALAFLLAAPAASGQGRSDGASPRLAPGEVLLEVQAQGEAQSRPDVLRMTAGVVTAGSSAREAMALNTALTNRLVEAVRASGIKPQDVRTTELSVRPQDEDSPDRSLRPRGPSRYLATTQLELRIRDIAIAPDLLDALFKAGANTVNGPSFSLSDPKPALRAARQAAIANAREQADTYAETLGMRVGRILRVSERGSYASEGAIVVTGSRIRANLEPGSLATTVTVWIDFALVPR